MEENTRIKWLKANPLIPRGVTWGVPWHKGELQRNEQVTLTGPDGKKKPLQTWITAYWPDGSVKWTAHAAAFSRESQPEYAISKGESQTPENALLIEEKDDCIEINTGAMICQLNRAGTSIIRSIYKDGRQVCTDGRLVCINENVYEEQKNRSGCKIIKDVHFESEISKAVIEQRGPVRAVLKIEGKHRSVEDGTEFLPFILRLYFYANTYSIKITHTFIYDGDEKKDFIKGLGFSFRIPVSGALYNRRVCFAGDTGLFSEVSQFLSKNFVKYAELYPQQVEGRILKMEQKQHYSTEDMVEDMAIWDSFKITQDSADHYTVRKRTKEDCCWIDAAHGKRAGGLAYIGGEEAGLAVGVKNFWQKFPSSIEINDLTKKEAVLNIWLWSPDANAMDLRHYDTETHMTSSYEGFRELRSSPYGIANTSEINLFCFSETPDNHIILDCAKETQNPSILVCDPEHYHRTKVFGVWSLCDRSTPFKAHLEENLDKLTNFYKEEIEQRKWYGFWNYGDIMHSYDAKRHSWCYDMGGYAWDNTELVPNMWLWYMFLRTGRDDIFRMAEAMTRHNSEVDVFRLGEYAGLGSRHNVVHWGCGCKEVRMSMAGLNRYYYYLTADERIGDILYEVKDADFATVNLDPMRYYFPKDEYPTHVRSGPDWAAFCSNWMTMWERFEDTAYRDKMLKGIACLKNMPFRLCSGPTFGYDPNTGELYYLGDENYKYHMAICFGGAEVWMEMAQLIEDPEWENALAEFGEFYNLDNEEKVRRTRGIITGKDWGFAMVSARMTAYAAAKMGDRSLAEKAWEKILDYEKERTVRRPVEGTLIEAPGYVKPIYEIPWINTNTASQWALNIIECLELIGDYLPEKIENVLSI